MKHQKLDQRLLQREAFDLVVAVYNDPKHNIELDAWCKQSFEHKRAVMQAKNDWQVMAQVDDVHLTMFDMIKLAIQLRLEKIAENLLELAPTIGVAMAFFVGVYLVNNA